MFETGAVVVEHSGAHVESGHDHVEAGLVQRVQHRQAFVGRLRPVVDGGDPVAVEVDEAAHAPSG